MKIEDELRTWLQEARAEGDGQVDVAAYDNNLAMAHIQGRTLRLGNPDVEKCPHLFLLVHRGELHLTVNGDRIGFEEPAYVDFLRNTRWEDVVLTGGFDAHLVMAEQSFFMESTRDIRDKITDGMQHFAQAPFTTWDEATARRVRLLSELIYDLLAGERRPFLREQLQALACAWQYEMWNTFYRQNQHRRTAGDAHWHDITSHFFYLAQTHCREQHEVSWYARQIGVSPDTLSATLKRTRGRTAGSILTSLLVREAKVCLRNPSLSVQQVAEMLGFSDQSAFGKFFKRECGVSPVQYKKEASSNHTTTL